MAAHIIDGKAVAAKVLEQVAQDAAHVFPDPANRPGLVVVIVGENPASEVYVRNKHRTCTNLGWNSRIEALPKESTQQQVLETIEGLNRDPRVHGILLQLPLPKHLDETPLLTAIHPDKDVDGFHPVNVGKLSLGLPAPVPCTPAGVQRILIEENIATSGKHAVIIGRSNIVGKPMAQLLVSKGPGGDATVTIAHSRTTNLQALVVQADIVIAAIGSPEFVRGEWLKPGATVIDVGINRINDPSHPKGQKLVGDVHFESALNMAGAITPVPGGVGPMTIAMLMHNTLVCAKLQQNL